MHRHSYKGRKLGRKKAPRELMLRNLATSIILHEKVKTTLPKAKEIRPIVERLITSAKKGDLNAIRKLNSYLLDKNATQKLISEVGPLYKERKGGYTRITKVGLRVGDAAQMAQIELLDIEKLVKKSKKKEKYSSAKASNDAKAMQDKPLDKKKEAKVEKAVKKDKKKEIKK